MEDAKKQNVESVEMRPTGWSLQVECVKQKMEGESKEGNSLAADMLELNKSTKVAQKAHPENKNEEVAKPELESEEKPAWFIDVASLDPAKFEYMPFYDHLYPFAGVDED